MVLAVAVAESLAFWVSEIQAALFDSRDERGGHDARRGKRRNVPSRYRVSQSRSP